MREIKFRAWDDNKRHMIQPSVNMMIDSYNGGAYWQYGFDTPEPITPTVMQFTALKDKNGREIYEGDIVTSDFERPLVVTWDYDGYALFDRIQGIGVRERSLDDEVEVIGNIYENPELLK